MAGKSIYDVEYSQQTGMPSDVLNENDYTQDVFFQTRPEVFDFDKRDRGEGPSQGDPYFKNYPIDDEVKYQEKSLDKYNRNPKEWDNQNSVLINPYNRSDKKGSAFRVVEAYLKESATPQKAPSKKKDYKPYDPNKPVDLKGRAPTLAKLMHYTSKFSKQRAPNTSVTIVKADPKKMTWTYKVTGKEKWSKKGGHIVNIVLEKQKGMKDFREMQIKVTCDCEFWKYWGPDFNSGNGGRGLDPYRLGPSKIDPGVSPAPNVRDPGRRNMICKHVAAVGKIFQKYAAKHNLDTYKEVEGIFDELEKQEKVQDPAKEIEGVKAIVERMERSEQKEMKPLIDRYEKETDDYRKERMRKGILMRLEDNIETKEKSWLQKILEFLIKFFRLNKKSSVQVTSVNRVLEMYLEKEIRDGEV